MRVNAAAHSLSNMTKILDNVSMTKPGRPMLTNVPVPRPKTNESSRIDRPYFPDFKESSSDCTAAHCSERFLPGCGPVRANRGRTGSQEHRGQRRNGKAESDQDCPYNRRFRRRWLQGCGRPGEQTAGH